MGLRAGSARPQRVSGSARTDSQRAQSARNPIASHVNFDDDSCAECIHAHSVDGGLYWLRATYKAERVYLQLAEIFHIEWPSSARPDRDAL